MRIKNFTAEPECPDEPLFFIGIGPGMGGWDAYRNLTGDEARQLRDELNAFLGEKIAVGDDPAINEALRRDNDDLTRQKTRLIASNSDLRAENARLKVELMNARAKYATTVEGVLKLFDLTVTCTLPTRDTVGY